MSGSSAELALMSIVGFTRRTYILGPKDVPNLEKFATLNNLSLSDILDHIEMVQNYSVIQNLTVLYYYIKETCFLFQKCHEVIDKYQFGLDLFHCNIDSCPGWRRVRTVHGTCCSFNHYPIETKLNASILNQAGKFGGMNILFRSLEGGLNLIIAQPKEYITFSNGVYSLLPGFDNYFRLYLTSDIISKYFEKLPLKSRQCMLSRDLGPILMFRSRCTLVCKMEYIYSVCGCHPYYMPFIIEKSKSIGNCTIKDLICFRNRTGKSIENFSFVQKRESFKSCSM